ncbi:MAG: hypothetical protein K2X25_03105 [Caulobacteraceae bacterium]|nr:hypothetical protein [Caulobacteraceae bacterium]
MTERREIRQRSQAVWDRVKAAYLAGEPARSVARRFDVGYGNLRYRANAEGWTRKAAMAGADAEAQAEAARLDGRADTALATAAEGPAGIDPETAGEAGIRHAAALIAAGRGSEALSLLKAVQGLAQFLEAQARPWDEAHIDLVEDNGAGRYGDEFDFRALERVSLEMAVKNAEAMLGDTGYGITSAFGHAAYHWRAANLGPEIARHDFEQGTRGGWARDYWEPDGTLKPLEGPFIRPIWWAGKGGSSLADG